MTSISALLDACLVLASALLCVNTVRLVAAARTARRQVDAPGTAQGPGAAGGGSTPGVAQASSAEPDPLPPTPTTLHRAPVLGNVQATSAALSAEEIRERVKAYQVSRPPRTRPVRDLWIPPGVSGPFFTIDADDFDGFFLTDEYLARLRPDLRFARAMPNQVLVVLSAQGKDTGAAETRSAMGLGGEKLILMARSLLESAPKDEESLMHCRRNVCDLMWPNLERWRQVLTPEAELNFAALTHNVAVGSPKSVQREYLARSLRAALLCRIREYEPSQAGKLTPRQEACDRAALAIAVTSAVGLLSLEPDPEHIEAARALWFEAGAPSREAPAEWQGSLGDVLRKALLRDALKQTGHANASDAATHLGVREELAHLLIMLSVYAARANSRTMLFDSTVEATHAVLGHRLVAAGFERSEAAPLFDEPAEAARERAQFGA